MQAEINRLNGLNEGLTVEVPRMQTQNTPLSAEPRSCQDHGRNLERENREMNATLAKSNSEANEVLAAIEQITIEIGGDGREQEDGNNLPNEAGGAGHGKGVNSGGNRSHGVDKNSSASPDMKELFITQNKILERMIDMHKAAAKGKEFSQWRTWSYWERNLIVAAPAGI